MLPEAVPDGSVLRVRVGPGQQAGGPAQSLPLARVAGAGEALVPPPVVSFAQMARMLAAFTPKRLELVAALRAAGPLSVRALASKLGRDYKNVHGDVAALEQWMAVQRLADGRVHVPWREITLDVLLPPLQAAASAPQTHSRSAHGVSHFSQSRTPISPMPDSVPDDRGQRSRPIPGQSFSVNADNSGVHRCPRCGAICAGQTRQPRPGTFAPRRGESSTSFRRCRAAARTLGTEPHTLPARGQAAQGPCARQRAK